MSGPRFLPLGDSALTVEFGDVIAPELMQAVSALDHAIRTNPPDGVIESVPTYRSLTIHFDPLQCTHLHLTDHVKDRLAQTVMTVAQGNHWLVPVCYDLPYALDKEEYQAASGLAFDQSITLHQHATFTIAMFGFMPGCAYLAGLPRALHVPRRTTPRPEVPAGSIMIGGQQALISSVAMPTGWYVIGRTPVTIFNADENPVTPFQVGDTISFTPIDAAQWESAKLQQAGGD
ncbi:MAG: allophanate hydrolase subunit 1 [Alphaproteobacteria bacterium]